MSTPPPDVVEFERTEQGLMVWFSDAEGIALGALMIASGLLNSDWLWREDLDKLNQVEREHVEDVLDRLRRAKGEPHYADSQPGDDW